MADGEFGLGDIANVLGGIGKIAGVIGTFVQGQKKRSPSENPALVDALQGAVNARTYSAAAADPTSAWFRNLSELFKQNQQNQALAGIKQLIRQRQNLIARGVTGGFNPERRDESIAKAAATSLAQAGIYGNSAAEQALLNAAQTAAGASRAAAGAIPGYQNYANIAAAQRIGKFQAGSELGTQISDQIKKMFGAGTPVAAPWVPPPGEPIYSGPSPDYGNRVAGSSMFYGY